MVNIEIIYILVLSVSLIVPALFVLFMGERLSYFVPIHKDGRYVSIDGIRGVLALMVMAHHIIINYYWRTSGKWVAPNHFIENIGVVAVSLFFIITGFLFFGKIFSSTPDWKKLFILRFFRIYPLYFLAILFVIFWSFILGSGIGFGILDFLESFTRWILFAVGGSAGDFFDYSNTQLVIAGVQWTLKYEWFFYLCLPIFFYIFRPSMIVFYIFSFAIMILAIMDVSFLKLNVRFILLFFCGGLSYVFLKDVVVEGKLRLFLNLVAILLFFSSLVLNRETHLGWLAQTLAIWMFFSLLVVKCDFFGLLSLKIMRILGEISYSIYLIHGTVIFSYFYFFPVEQGETLLEYSQSTPIISALVVLFSIVTFYGVERQGMNLGKRFSS
ncbi:MAG: acyltransferase [Oleibacter sp.]|nr:acyltransferase [Thalassolituus sp.]